MKKIIVLLFLILIAQISTSQWISNYYGGDPGRDISLANAHGECVTVDNNGNCLVAGYVNNESTGNDILVIKYDSSGDTLWSRSYNGSENSDDEAFGIAADDYGNVYVTGEASIVGKSYEAILIKYDASGTLKWAKTYGGSSNFLEDKGVAIALDHDGYIYVTGFCTMSDGHTQLLTIKYDSGGNKKWDKKEDGPDNMNSEGSGIAIDSHGNIAVTGYCMTNTGNKDVIVVKYNSYNSLLWSRTFNGEASEEDRAFGIAVDETDNLYISGFTTVDAQAGNTDCLILKYNSEGTFQWSKTYSGSGENSEDRAFGIAVDELGDAFITGYVTNSSTMKDYITIKYGSNGSMQWASLYNGTGNGNDKADAIALLNDGANIVVTGSSWGTNNNDDYATVKYGTSAGDQLLVSRYSLSYSSEDVAMDITSNSSQTQAYLTGYSELLISGPIANSVVSTIMLPWGNERSELIKKSNFPQNFRLGQNYPNPFNPVTNIKFEIPDNSYVTLKIFDVTGKTVSILINQFLKSGSYEISFTSDILSSGVYFYELIAGSNRDIKKMTLVK